MRFPRELYQLQQQLTQRLPGVRPAHVLGLALWVYGTVLAKSACFSAVVNELEDLMSRSAARQRLREWLKDGRDNARPCHSQVEVTVCFPLLLRWVISWWEGSITLPLAIDAVSHQDRAAVQHSWYGLRMWMTPRSWRPRPTGFAYPQRCRRQPSVR